MIAKWKNTIIAEAKKVDLIYIEGSWYFPKSSVKTEFLVPSDTRTTCFWKGEASYYNIVIDGETNDDAAWFYPTPLSDSIKRVKQDFSGYVAFWRGVEVSE
jgi:uncharacterized protein (DUF427 family)